jgi:phosphatidate cytidylyltransferase
MGRVIPGLFMAAGWLLLLVFAPFTLFWAVVVIGSLIGLIEYFRMTRKGFSGVQASLLIIAAALPVAASYFQSADAVMAGLTTGLLAMVALVLFNYRRIDDALQFLSLGVFAILYIGFCTAHLVLLHTLENGASWIIVLTAMTAGSDTGAYYAGRSLGRTKLCPHISPGKTVAGVVGGVVVGILAAEVVCWISPIKVGMLAIGLVTLVLVLIGIAGDLLESVIKRSVEVKDSGTLLQGHGGLLDRIDSLLLTAPVLYYLLSFSVLR